MHSDPWQPRMSLLAPFDICLPSERNASSVRVRLCHENFLPKNNAIRDLRAADSMGDRSSVGSTRRWTGENEKLVINSVHAEPGVPATRRSR